MAEIMKVEMKMTKMEGAESMEEVGMEMTEAGFEKAKVETKITAYGEVGIEITKYDFLRIIIIYI